jgi:hypothetical protein
LNASVLGSHPKWHELRRRWLLPHIFWTVKFNDFAKKTVN